MSDALREAAARDFATVTQALVIRQLLAEAPLAAPALPALAAEAAVMLAPGGVAFAILADEVPEGMEDVWVGAVGAARDRALRLVGAVLAGGGGGQG